MVKKNFVNTGRFLKERRIKAGLKQVDVAHKLKCKSQFICNWERGASTPPWRLLKTLIKIYGISENEILHFLLKEYEGLVRSKLGFKTKK